jgi:CMP/dCMP kinase
MLHSVVDCPIVTSGGVSAPPNLFQRLIQHPGFVLPPLIPFIPSIEAPLILPNSPLGLLITLDGLSGSGKTTIGQALARSLNICHLESGYVFKAVAKALLHDPQKPALDQAQTIAQKIQQVTINHVADTDLNQAIYAELVPVLSGKPEIQDLFYATVRRLSRQLGSSVVTGRSVGHHLRGQAKRTLRIFLRVSPQVGAYRKAMQFEEMTSPAQTELATLRRNWEDMFNEVVYAPPNALVIDTDRLSIDEVVAIAETAIRRKMQLPLL